MAGHSGLAGSAGDGVIIGGSASIKTTLWGSGAILVQDQVLLATFLLVKPFWVIRL
jgi:hypothetical protein